MMKYQVFDTRKGNVVLEYISIGAAMAHAATSPDYAIKPIRTVNRKDLTVEDVCPYCKSDLRKAKEIHVVEGFNFCSKECAINYNAETILLGAREQAEQWYNDCAETVLPRDIGMTKEVVWHTYSERDDVTTIFTSVYDSDGEPVCTEVTGFYFGEPTEENTKLFNGSLMATF